jgi:hypothetical protein
VLLQSGPAETDVLQAAARLVGIFVVAAVAVAAAALVYRWYTRERFPAGLATLFGLAAAGLSLNTLFLFGQLSGPDGSSVFNLATVAFNLVALGVAAVAAPIGRSVGDRVAAETVAAVGTTELEGEVSRLVGVVGSVRSVTLPEEVGDIEGYDPVPRATKERLAGKTLLFPRRLSGADLRERLAARITGDYDVGHVDVEIEADGTVSYLAVGSRVAGIGHTLAPGSVAVCLRADPAAGAGPGDLVQVWRADPPERVAVAELRGTTAETATVVLDEADAAAVDVDESYRLVTLPFEPRADREFASVLRAAAETLGVVTVTGDGPLDGVTVRESDLTVAAVRPPDGPIHPVPAGSRVLSPGDDVYVVARPDTLRRLGAG